MPQLDLDSLVSGKIACETMATSDPNHHHHSDFPVESFYLPKEDELEWFSRNAFYERKESTKGNGNNHNNSNSTLTSNQNSQRFSKSSIIGLPKKQDSHFSVSKRRKPVSVKFFPKRTRSNNRVSEPSSPKVSCMGRVRSKKDKSRTPSKKNEAVSTSHRRESERRTGFWSWAFNCCKSEGVDADEKNISNFEAGAEKDFIWEAVKTEAKLEAEKEPILSSFLYASIMSHGCLERALGFTLANRLQNPVLLATQLMDIFDDVMMHDRGIQRSIRLDVQAFEDRDPSCLSYCWVVLYLKGYQSLQSYRVAHALWNKGRKVLALALQSRISEVFGVDIHPAAKIGDGILLDHATGVVIGETAVIGNRVSLMQGVTLGGTGKESGDRHPKIGQGALIGASARILGNIKIGEGAMVAAGSLVLKDIPPHGMVAGVPAKVVGYVEEQHPSLTMKHDATKGFWPTCGS